jgi:hypothetical protein
MSRHRLAEYKYIAWPACLLESGWRSRSVRQRTTEEHLYAWIHIREFSNNSKFDLIWFEWNSYGKAELTSQWNNPQLKFDLQWLQKNTCMLSFFYTRNMVAPSQFWNSWHIQDMHHSLHPKKKFSVSAEANGGPVGDALPRRPHAHLGPHTARADIRPHTQRHQRPYPYGVTFT